MNKTVVIILVLAVISIFVYLMLNKKDESLTQEQRQRIAYNDLSDTITESEASLGQEYYNEYLDSTDTSQGYCTSKLPIYINDYYEISFDGLIERAKVAMKATDDKLILNQIIDIEIEQTKSITNIIRIMTQLCNNNREKLGGIVEDFVKKLILIFKNFNQINSSEIQDVGTTCNFQNYINRSMFIFPIYMQLLMLAFTLEIFHEILKSNYEDIARDALSEPEQTKFNELRNVRDIGTNGGYPGGYPAEYVENATDELQQLLEKGWKDSDKVANGDEARRKLEQAKTLCFSSEKEYNECRTSYINVIKALFLHTVLVHAFYRINKLETLAKADGDEPEQLAEKLQKKTRILTDLSLKAPLAASAYALISMESIDPDLLGTLPYEVGGAYIMQGVAGKGGQGNRLPDGSLDYDANPNKRNFIILTPEYESNLQCTPLDDLKSPSLDFYAQGYSYITGDKIIDDQINEYKDEVDNAGTIQLTVQEQQNFYSNITKHEYSDGTAVINIDNAFVNRV